MNRIQNHVEGGIATVYDRHKYEKENQLIQEKVSEFLNPMSFNREGKNIPYFRKDWSDTPR
jgi:hypothetical protein